jgi:hypothetical protein
MAGSAKLQRAGCATAGVHFFAAMAQLMAHQAQRLRREVHLALPTHSGLSVRSLVDVMIAELRPEPDSLHLGQPAANMIAIMQMDGTKKLSRIAEFL